MAKPSKSTKKFQSKHLKHTLDHRREVQKHNKKVQQRKRGKGTKDEAEADATTAAVLAAGAPREVFADMLVDAFFDGGFEVPKEKKFGKKAASAAAAAAADAAADADAGSDSALEDEEAMKADMKALAEKDPEFYRYLQENDKELLDFEGVNPLDAMSDSAEEEGEGEEAPAAAKKAAAPAASAASAAKVEITLPLVAQWRAALASKPSLKTIRNVASAFKAAVNIQSAPEEDYKYAVTDPAAFLQLMLVALQDVPAAVQRLVKYKVHAASGARLVPEKNPQLHGVSAVLKLMAGPYITLLRDITNTETAALVLALLQEVLPYYLLHRRLLKELVAAVMGVWALTPQVETQVATFAFLNNAAREFPRAVLETVLKQTYSVFLKNCRHTNVHTMGALNFCKNSAAELFGIDATVGYQVGFEYVRQAAIHLRNSISATLNAQQGYKTIYNWQYCHSLDFWLRVVARGAAGAELPLHQLIYPLVQVTLGTIRLIPTAQFFPLRFYLVRSLLRVQQGTGVYVPVFPLLAEILTLTAITKPPKRLQKGARLEPVDFDHNIKVNQAYLGLREFQDGLCEQFVELTAEFFGLYSRSIAFPELATPAILVMRRFTKRSKNIRFNKQLQQLVEKLTANSEFIAAKRSNVEYGPLNKHEVEQFLQDLDWAKTPLGQYVSVQRQVKEERLRILRESAEEKPEEAEESDIEVVDESGEEESGEDEMEE